MITLIGESVDECLVSIGGSLELALSLRQGAVGRCAGFVDLERVLIFAWRFCIRIKHRLVRISRRVLNVRRGRIVRRVINSRSRGCGVSGGVVRRGDSRDNLSDRIS